FCEANVCKMAPPNQGAPRKGVSYLRFFFPDDDGHLNTGSASLQALPKKRGSSLNATPLPMKVPKLLIIGRSCPARWPRGWLTWVGSLSHLSLKNNTLLLLLFRRGSRHFAFRPIGHRSTRQRHCPGLSQVWRPDIGGSGDRGMGIARSFLPYVPWEPYKSAARQGPHRKEWHSPLGLRRGPR